MKAQTTFKDNSGFVSLVLKYLLLVVLFFAIYMLVNVVVPSGLKATRPEQAGIAVLMLFVNCMLLTLVTLIPIQLSSTYGWKLVLGLLVPLLLNTIVLAQIEVVVFNVDVGIPASSLWLIVVQTFVRLALFVPLAVWILGKMKKPEQAPLHIRFDYAWSGWLWRFALIAAFFVCDYFLCGFFVAWQSTAVREYYASGANINLQVVIPTQIVRGLLWALAALPVIKILRGRTLETAIVLGLLMSFYHGIGLIMPNSFMPDGVRQAHLVEILISITAVGIVSALVLRTKLARPAEAHVEKSLPLAQPSTAI